MSLLNSSVYREYCLSPFLHDHELRDLLDQLSDAEKKDLVQIAKYHVLLEKIQSENTIENDV
ncbi:MAG: hypothetical protein KAT16_09440 [Candidatus Heimdallarchaeota archaeon]|nr:hypothetical protein [Candidatus Heimdallarchaeota archaeon]